jgi:TRAP-type C4-dicarboxylate transport system permease small subunit
VNSGNVVIRVGEAYAKFAKWVAAISGIVVMIMMVYTTVDVGGRYLARHPMPAAYEMTIIFLIYITYFGVTLVQARGGHMRLGFLYEKAGPRGKSLIDLFSVLFGLFIVGIITWQGWVWAIESWQIQEVTMGIYTVPVFPGRIALAIGSTIFIIQYIIDVIKCIMILVNPALAAIITASPPSPDAGAATIDAGEAGAKP